MLTRISSIKHNGKTRISDRVKNKHHLILIDALINRVSNNIVMKKENHTIKSMMIRKNESNGKINTLFRSHFHILEQTQKALGVP